MSKQCFAKYIDDLSKTYPDYHNVVLLDNSKIHDLDCIPDNVSFIRTEPYSPELNPAERVWQYIKDGLAWQTFSSLDSLNKYVQNIISNIQKNTFKSIVSYPYIIKSIKELLYM